MDRFYEAVGAQLGYSDYGTGSGLPVIFLHPTPLDRTFWIPLTQELGDFRVIAPDLRGHGASQLGDGLPVGAFARVPDAPALTMARLAEDLLALLDRAAVGAAVFAGCSIGGYVLLELWRRAPERMRGLAFLCSKPQPDTETNLAKRAETIARARAGESAVLFDGMAQNLVGATTRKLCPEVSSELRSRMTLTPEALVAVQAGLAVRPDSMPTVATINVPVLAIAGAEDTTVPPIDMEAFQTASGGCTYYVIPGAGHFAAYERPEAMGALVMPWLRQFAG